ncbi:hypothetical protein [Mycoplasmopsis verecunda]|uniref:Uncharacterized protein n=1 Tax=Mycoplasmopsis verecunda TaxID=171291 RepID=A0A1T4KYE8_9BACT|nr:hypothetical protein [Mycoplasmopsis verecunda]WPB54352.1 hypothetical protein SAM46_02580 [Mycoplasmopsis verecunda]SJZ47485.1 hypothetical protein SAMN02745154_00251 [Mycoplasmopsis verecunda]
MEISEIRQLCIDSLSAVPGIVKLHKPSIDLDKPCSDAEECSVLLPDLINVSQSSSGLSIQLAITTLDGVPTKFIISQLFKQLDFLLKKKKLKLSNLTVIVKGVTNAG